MAEGDRARFEINGTPSEDPSTGDRGFAGTSGQTLTVQLEDDTDVLSCQYEVHDPNGGEENPRKSYQAPDITWTTSTTAIQNAVPAGAAYEIDLPVVGSAVSYEIRCRVVTSQGQETFSRIVSIFQGGARKEVAGERQEYYAVGQHVVQNLLVDLLGGVGGAQTWANTLGLGTASGPNNPQINVGQYIDWAGEVDVRRQTVPVLTTSTANTMLRPGAGGNVALVNSAGAFKAQYKESDNEFQIASAVPINWPVGEALIQKAGFNRFHTLGASTLIGAADGGSVNFLINSTLYANVFDDTGGTGAYGLNISSVVGSTAFVGLGIAPSSGDGITLHLQGSPAAAGDNDGGGAWVLPGGGTGTGSPGDAGIANNSAVPIWYWDGSEDVMQGVRETRITRDALTTTQAYGLRLRNTTAGTGGTPQQFSPMFTFEGHSADDEGLDQQIEAAMQLQPAASDPNAQFQLAFLRQVPGGGGWQQFADFEIGGTLFPRFELVAGAGGSATFRAAPINSASKAPDSKLQSAANSGAGDDGDPGFSDSSGTMVFKYDATNDRIVPSKVLIWDTELGADPTTGAGEWALYPKADGMYVRAPSNGLVSQLAGT